MAAPGNWRFPARAMSVCGRVLQSSLLAFLQCDKREFPTPQTAQIPRARQMQTPELWAVERLAGSP